MKKILTAFCILLAVYALCFPAVYFGKDKDKMEIRSSHILVQSEEEALRIKQEIENGKKFASAAEEYSECPSKEQKGDLGYNERGRLDKTFEEAVYKLPKGVISEPVKTQFGWHLIKVTDIKYYSDKNHFKNNSRNI